MQSQALVNLMHGLRLGKVQAKSTKKDVNPRRGSFPDAKRGSVRDERAESGAAKDGKDRDGRGESWLKGPGLSTLRTEKVLPDSGQN